jgi:hypothetical protein
MVIVSRVHQQSACYLWYKVLVAVDYCIYIIIGLPYDHPHLSGSQQLAYKNFGC